MWADVDLREIRAFLVLADELHFGRTADQLDVTHARVSQLIRTLETRVGGRLFERTSRRVRLTALGEHLLSSLAPAYADVQRALKDAHELAGAQAAPTGTLRLGFVVTIPGEPVTRLVDRFEQQHPDCRVVLREHPITWEQWDMWQPLRAGETDALVYFNTFPQSAEPDLTLGPVIEWGERVLLVARDHKLAELASVSAEDLADEEVAKKSPTLPASVMDLLIPPLTPSGRPIRRTGEARSFQEIMTLVARGRIVHPTITGNALARRDDIIAIPMHGLPPIGIGLVWHTRSETANIHALARTAAAISTKNPATATP